MSSGPEPDPQPHSRSFPLLLAGALLLPSLITWVYFDWLHGSEPWRQQLAYAIGKGIQFGLPLWLAWRGWGGSLERPTPRWPGLTFGALFGLGVCILLPLAHYWLIAGTEMEHNLLTTARAKIASLGLNSPLQFLGVGLFYAAMHSLLEEYYWRWFVFGWGISVWGKPLAYLLSSLGFMAHHVLLLGHFLGFADWRTYLLAASIAVGGAFWAWLYHRTENLSAAWLSHAIVDAGIFAFGYFLLFD